MITSRHVPREAPRIAPAREVAGKCREQIRDLCEDLGIRGERRDRHLFPLCPWRADRTPGSFIITLVGEHKGEWHDYATGDHGDALDLIARTRTGGSMPAALDWARRWLGLPTAGRGAEASDLAAPRVARERDDREVDDREHRIEARRRAALTIFLSAQSSLAGTPAGTYLLGRGINLAELGRQPRALRYHPALRNTESGTTWPALVAAVSSVEGEFRGVHRTWLAERPDDDGVLSWCKAPLQNAKMTLGKIAGCTIRLWRGASRKPLAEAPVGETAVIAEGIETGLSVAIACPHLRVLCSLSLSNMSQVLLPRAISTVIIAADNDGGNAAAARGLAKAVAHFAAEGREVRVAHSPVGKDFNDALRAETPQ